MKKFTLAMSMLLGVSAMAMADSNTPPVVSSNDAPKTYVIINYRGYPVNPPTCTILDAPNTEEALIQTQVTEDSEIPETAFWYFITPEEAEYPGEYEEGAICIRNYVAGEEFGVTANPGHMLDWFDNEAAWYILPNGVNTCGLTISAANPFSGTTCLDAANFGLVLSGGWHPSANDWLGTTWIFLEATPDEDPEELNARVLAAYNDSHFGPLKSNANLAIDALEYAFPGTTGAAFAEVKEAVANMTAKPGADLNEIQAEINEMIAGAADQALEALNAYAIGKSFTIENVRRYQLRERENNKFDGALLCLADGVKVTVEGADVDPETGEVYDPGDTIRTEFKSFNTCAEVLGSTQFTLVPAEGGFMIKNAHSDVYAGITTAAASVNVYQAEEAEAGVYKFGYFITGANSGITLVAVDLVDSDGEPFEYEDPENPPYGGWALNIDTNGNYLVSYYANDGGSTWALTEVDPTGVENVAVEAASNGVVEMFNIQGVRVNANTTAPGMYIIRQGNNVQKVVK